MNYVPSKKPQKSQEKEYSKVDCARNVTRHALLILFFLLLIL